MELEKGWDVFFPDTGTVSSMTCPVCREEMEVKRNQDGPTGWAEAMGKGKHLHDEFFCVHADKKWHRQVKALRQAALTTPSAKLAIMYVEEVEEILKTKEATKEWSRW